MHLNSKIKLLLLSWVILFPFATGAVIHISNIERNYSILAMFIVFLGIGLTITWLVSKKGQRLDFSSLFLSIYFYNALIVITLALVFQFQFGNYYLMGGTDDRNFDNCAIYASETFQDTGNIVIKSPRWEKYRGYITVVAMVHTFSKNFGSLSTINPRLLNSLAIGLTSVMLLLVCTNLGYSANVSYLGAFISGIYPVQAYWGGVIIRDIIVIFLIMLTILFYIKLNKKISFKIVASSICLFTSLFLLWSIRKESAYLATFVIIFIYIYQKNIARPVHIKVIQYFFLFFLMIMMMNYIQTAFQTINTMAENAGLYRSNLSGGMSATIFNLPLIPFGLVLRPVYALISPLPVLSLNPIHFIQSTGTIIWLLLLPYGIIGLGKALIDRDKCPMALSGILFLLGISLTTFHPRHLLIYAPFGFVVNVYGCEIANNKIMILLFSCAIYLITFFIYLNL